MTKKLTQNRVAQKLNRQLALKGVTAKTKGAIDQQTEKRLALFAERQKKLKQEQFYQDMRDGNYDDLI